jgi:hypothetical protein
MKGRWQVEMADGREVVSRDGRWKEEEMEGR